MATAEALVIGLHLATAHFAGASASEMQAVTPGIYVRAASGLTAGAYRNSDGRGSVYAGWTWATANGRWAITAGAVTGYPHARLSPLVVPSMRLELGGGWGLRVAGLPKPHSGGAAGVHVAIEGGWR